MIYPKDTRIPIRTSNEFRMELFTQFPNDIIDIKYPLFKMGRFRARREDNEQGERYYLSDVRESGEKVNAILLHDDFDLQVMRKFKIEPNYKNDRVKVYRFGYYANNHPTHALEINAHGIKIIDKSL